jgi:hypothetical protein
MSAPETLLAFLGDTLAETPVPDFARSTYDLLPLLYSDDDADSPGLPPLDRPLLRYLAAVGAVADEIVTLVDRITYTAPDDGGPPGDSSDLVDPESADPAWLGWLAQLVGVDLTGLQDDTARRDAIRESSTGYSAGNRAAIAAAARSALTGTRYVRVDAQKIPGPPGAPLEPGTVWDITLTTRPSETPDLGAVLAAVEAKHAKPAGVVLHHRAYSATWGTVETSHPTWADWEAAGSWAAIEETGT